MLPSNTFTKQLNSSVLIRSMFDLEFCHLTNVVKRIFNLLSEKSCCARVEIFSFQFKAFESNPMKIVPPLSIGWYGSCGPLKQSKSLNYREEYFKLNYLIRSDTAGNVSCISSSKVYPKALAATFGLNFNFLQKQFQF